MKKTITNILLFATMLGVVGQQPSTDSIPSPLGVAIEVAEGWRTTHTETSWEGTQGLINEAFIRLFEQTKDSTYWTYATELYDYLLDEQGFLVGYEDTTFTSLRHGLNLLWLRDANPSPRYTRAVLQLKNLFRQWPTTSDGLYQPQGTADDFICLDQVAVTMPFIIRYAVQFYDHDLLEDAIQQLILLDQRTEEISSGLNYHYCLTGTKGSENASRYVFGIAQGLFMNAILSTIELLPPDHPQRPTLINIFQRQSQAVLAARDKTTRLWNLLLNMPYIRTNYIETTGSILLCYNLLRGIQAGLVAREHLTTVREAIEVIQSNFLVRNKKGLLNITHCAPEVLMTWERITTNQFSAYFTSKPVANSPLAVSTLIQTLLIEEQLCGGRGTRKELNIAYLLPFQPEVSNRDATMDRFVDFYVGALIGIQSEQQVSLPIKVHAFNVPRDGAMLGKMLLAGDLDNMDAIIGPAYSKHIDTVAFFAKEHNIPLFVPFSSKLNKAEGYGNVFRFNFTEDEEIEVLADELRRRRDDVNCVFMAGIVRPSIVEAIDSVCVLNDIPHTTTSLYKVLCDSLFVDLLPDKENIFFFNAEKFADLHIQLPHLKTQRDHYDITMFSHYSWQKETTSVPQWYASVFKRDLADALNKDYKTVFTQYFNYAHPTGNPRYDLIGYDLTRYVIQLLRDGDALNEAHIAQQEYHGIQSDIHFMRPKNSTGAFHNERIYLYKVSK